MKRLSIILSNIFLFLSCIFIGIILFREGPVLPMQGALIILISSLSLVWALRMRKKSVTIIVVSSMFFLTYALRLVLIHVDPYLWTSPSAWITLGAVGRFDFSANSFWELTAIVFTGIVLIVSSVFEPSQQRF